MTQPQRRVSSVADSRESGGRSSFDLAFAGLMGMMLVVVLMTASDYGISVDEFLFDVYGAKSLSFYTSLGLDRSSLEWYDDYLYGPWFHILVTWVQSFELGAPFDVRHVMTGLLSLTGLVAVFLIGRRVFNARVGLVACVLPLLSGNYYGHMFNSPADAPFLVTMTWAVWAIIRLFDAPVGPARTVFRTSLCGFVVGLAIATRVGGFILCFYVAGAVLLVIIDAMYPSPESRLDRRERLSPVAAVLAGVVIAVVAGAVAWVLWPWIQDEPITRLREALSHFGRISMDYESVVWGLPFRTSQLPWFYIPLNLIARLAEPFTVLLFLAFCLGGAVLVRFAIRVGTWRDGVRSLVGRALAAPARERGVTIVVVAALFPLFWVLVSGAVLYDGIRHVMFAVPMLALLAARAAELVWPVMLRLGAAGAGAAGAIVGFCLCVVLTLHPDEYIRISAFAGGTRDGAPKFETDYWGNGVAEGVERLREFLKLEETRGRPIYAPRVMIAVSYRENLTQPYLPPEWVHVDRREDADFAVAPTRWLWQAPSWAEPIALVSRQGIVLAVVYDMRNRPDDQ